MSRLWPRPWTNPVYKYRDNREFQVHVFFRCGNTDVETRETKSQTLDPQPVSSRSVPSKLICLPALSSTLGSFSSCASFIRIILRVRPGGPSVLLTRSWMRYSPNHHVSATLVRRRHRQVRFRIFSKHHHQDFIRRPLRRDAKTGEWSTSVSLNSRPGVVQRQIELVSQHARPADDSSPRSTIL